jgi:hypothetical protein
MLRITVRKLSMKASTTFALCLVCLAGYAKVIDSPPSAGSQNSVETDLAKPQTLMDDAGLPAQIAQPSKQEGAIPGGAVLLEGAGAPPAPQAGAPSSPQSAMPSPLPPDGSTQLVRGLLKQRDFSAQIAVLWFMAALGLGVLGLMVWRGAVLLHERYTEYREMEPYHRAQSPLSPREVPAAGVPLEEEQAAQRDSESASDSPGDDRESSAMLEPDTRPDQAVGGN